MKARDAYEQATQAFVDALKDERAKGTTMDAIATTLGVSRQYVNKMLKGR